MESSDYQQINVKNSCTFHRKESVRGAKQRRLITEAAPGREWKRECFAPLGGYSCVIESCLNQPPDISDFDLHNYL